MHSASSKSSITSMSTKYKRPVAPVPNSARSWSTNEGSLVAVLVDPEFVARYEEWAAATAIFDEAKSD